MENNPPFAIGQKVVCVYGKGIFFKWVSNIRFTKHEGPQYNDICTVGGYDNDGYILLKEWPNHGEGFLPSCFAPIQPAYSNISKEIAESVKAVSECPDKIIIKEPVNN